MIVEKSKFLRSYKKQELVKIYNRKFGRKQKYSESMWKTRSKLKFENLSSNEL